MRFFFFQVPQSLLFYFILLISGMDLYVLFQVGTYNMILSVQNEIYDGENNRNADRRYCRTCNRFSSSKLRVNYFTTDKSNAAYVLLVIYYTTLEYRCMFGTFRPAVYIIHPCVRLYNVHTCIIFARNFELHKSETYGFTGRAV